MRENVQYEGIDFGWLTPAAWVTIALLGLVADAIAARGYGFDSVHMQSLTILACFAGMIAMAGTIQCLNRLSLAGRRRMVVAIVGCVLLVSCVTMTVGLDAFASSR